ncbi:MAG: glycosyltransferase [Candidatus Altiarchaeota archaeon]|nr:glycosyltransferase [Candidatus Altiarchaeota archaeon]
MAIEISVVVPTRNRRGLLERCLSSLSKQAFRKDKFEVIVADNGSADGTADMVKELAGKTGYVIKYVNEPARGASKARNAGIQAASGQFIAFIDDDAYADENWLDEIMGWLNAGEMDVGGRIVKNAEIASVSGRVAIGNPESTIAWYSEKSPYPIFGLEQSEKPYIGPKTGHPTCNTAYRRSVLDEIGFFDESMSIYGEDDDLGMRASKKGYLHLYNPKALVYHNHPSNVMELAGRWFRMAANQPVHRGGYYMRSALVDCNPLRVPSRRFLLEYWHLIPVDIIVRTALAAGLLKSFLFGKK